MESAFINPLRDQHFFSSTGKQFIPKMGFFGFNKPFKRACDYSPEKHVFCTLQNTCFFRLFFNSN